MREALREFLVCPACGGTLRLEVFERAGNAVESGALSCQSCGEAFPVIRQIPRMLLGAMRRDLAAEHPNFFSRYGANGLLDPAATPTVTSEVDRTKLATARSFGYEWSNFSELLDEYEWNFQWYMEPLDAAFFEGKLVLDAGCGTGRHTHYAGRTGAHVVAVDVSRAIDVAASNNRANPNAHFVQADLTSLPFRPGAFDFVYSLGVLHHLPDPEGAFRSLLRYLRPGGQIRVYLYWSLESESAFRRGALRVVTAMRTLTTRVPHRLLRPLTFGIACCFHVVFVWPHRLLSLSASTRSLAERVPLKQYARYPFRVLHTDQFDRFSAPIEHRYTRAEVLAWFERAGLSEISILPGVGWRAMGRLPGASRCAEAPCQHVSQTV